MKLELTLREELLQSRDELAAEDAAQLGAAVSLRASLGTPFGTVRGAFNSITLRQVI